MRYDIMAQSSKDVFTPFIFLSRLSKLKISFTIGETIIEEDTAGQNLRQALCREIS